MKTFSTVMITFLLTIALAMVLAYLVTRRDERPRLQAGVGVVIVSKSDADEIGSKLKDSIWVHDAMLSFIQTLRENNVYSNAPEIEAAWPYIKQSKKATADLLVQWSDRAATIGAKP